MIFAFWRKRQDPRQRSVDAAYRAIVVAARQPALYARGGVPDTMSGRFDMIVLHLWLVLARLKAERTEETDEFSRLLTERMFADMDDNLRELGVADTGVARRIRQMAEAFFGRLRAYDAAIATDDPHSLRHALARNALGDERADAAALHAYVDVARRALTTQPAQAILAGEITFPPIDGTR